MIGSRDERADGMGEKEGEREGGERGRERDREKDKFQIQLGNMKAVRETHAV